MKHVLRILELENLQNLNQAIGFRRTLEFIEVVRFLFGRLVLIRADGSIILRASFGTPGIIHFLSLWYVHSEKAEYRFL